jgi:hypothetical protein
MTGLLAATLLVSLLVGMAAPALAAASTTYTLDADFDQGTLVNVNHDAPNNDQLQLDDTVEPFDFIWVAVSSRGTAVKIDVNTGAVLGEYLTSPLGNGNPSRTTVDNNGNVWVANRNNVGPTGKGTVIHIASIPTDQDNSGTIVTSSGLGDVLAWGTDEAVLHYVEVNSTGTRHLSVDANNDVWVGGLGGARAFDHIDGNTGLLIGGDSYAGVGYGGYGGLMDPNGVIWSARPLLRWNPANPLSGLNGYVAPNPPNPPVPNWAGYPHDSYGLGIDSSGNVWNSALSGNIVRKFAPNGVLLGTYAHGSWNAQGVVAGLNDHIWVAHSLFAGNDTVGHILNDGTFIGNVDLEPTVVNANVGPTGVAVDANGKIWTTGNNNGKVYRIDPTAGPIGADFVTPVGAVDLVVPLGGNLYNYSDMTGSTLIAPPNSGSWTVVNDSGIPGAKWTTISWTAHEPGDSSIVVSVASSADGVTFGPLQPVSNGQNMQTVPVPDGQYLKIVVDFARSTTDDDNDGVNDSPILYDLTVEVSGIGTIKEPTPFTPDPTGNGRAVAFDGIDLYYTITASNDIYKVSTTNVPLATITTAVDNDGDGVADEDPVDGLDNDLDTLIDEDPPEADVLFGSLSWDAGRGLLWGGTYDGSTQVYTIDPATGIRTLMFDETAFGGIAQDSAYGLGPENFIDGLAYDATDDTLWLSGDACATIYHVTTAGVLISSSLAPNHPTTGAQGYNTGITVAPGGYLEIAMQAGADLGPHVIAKVAKEDPSTIIISFVALATNNPGIEGIAFDGNTYAPRAVVWTNQFGASNKLTAFDVQVTRTIGYWKNHPAADFDGTTFLPIDLGISDVSGLPCETVSTDAEVEAVLKAAKANDAEAMLKAQLLAAKLNLAMGDIPPADVAAITPVIDAADELLGRNDCNPDTGKKGADRAEAVDLASQLDMFNNMYSP